MEQIRILIAEDHEIVRMGICGLIEKIPDMEVIGEAMDGDMAVWLSEKLKPDIVIMDVMLPGMNGIEATRQICVQDSKTKIVTLSLHSDREYVTGMLKAGSSGYLLKDSAFQELVDAIRCVIGGRVYLGKSLIQSISKDMLGLLGDAGDIEILTPDEKKILLFLRDGKRPNEIASLLSITQDAVEKHRDKIINKWLILFQ